MIATPAYRSDLRRLQASRAHDVTEKKGSRLFTLAALDQIENVQMLDRLLWQPASIDRHVIFDQAAQPIDAADRVQKELVLRAGDQHFMKLVVCPENLRTRPGLITAIAQPRLHVTRLPETIEIGLEAGEQHGLLLDDRAKSIAILVALAGRQCLPEGPAIAGQPLDPALLRNPMQDLEQLGARNIVEPHQLVLADTLVQLAGKAVLCDPEIHRIVPFRFIFVCRDFLSEMLSIPSQKIPTIKFSTNDALRFELLQRAHDRRARNPKGVRQHLQRQMIPRDHPIRLDEFDDVSGDLRRQAFARHEGSLRDWPWGFSIEVSNGKTSTKQLPGTFGVNDAKIGIYDHTPDARRGLLLLPLHIAAQTIRSTPMKVFAIASSKPTLTPDELKKHMPNEVPATLKHYLDGTVEQMWFREGAGPIFLMNVESVDKAKASLDTLPLVAAGHMSYELMPVGPLMPLGMLIQGK